MTLSHSQQRIHRHNAYGFTCDTIHHHVATSTWISSCERIRGYSGDTQRAKPAPTGQTHFLLRCCAILAIICVVVGGLVVFLLVSITRGVVRSFRSPHGYLYAAPGTNKSTVQPLFDKDTHFDVAVTVWARRANANAAHPEMYADDWAERVDLTEAQSSLGSRVSMPLVEFSHRPEDIIFSQVVFKDCSLNDTDRDLDVSFELPLARL